MQNYRLLTGWTLGSLTSRGCVESTVNGTGSEEHEPVDVDRPLSVVTDAGPIHPDPNSLQESMTINNTDP